MSNELYLYTTPKTTEVTVTPDDTQVPIHGIPVTVHGRDDAHLCQIPSNTPMAHGCRVQVAMAGYVPFEGRGLLIPSTTDEAKVLMDDIHLTPLPTPVPPEPTVPRPPDPSDPEAVIRWVAQRHNLTTTEGGGKFVEDCALTLYTYTSPMWGHVLKHPSQNQYNGHAVDAIHCLAGADAGIWDIIKGAEEPGAEPAYNYAGPPDTAIWYPGSSATPPHVLRAVR